MYSVIWRPALVLYHCTQMDISGKCCYSNVSVFIQINRMAHWFHRNPLKATAPVSFNFYGVAGSPAANKICKYVFFSV